MKIDEFASEIYNHIFNALDCECTHSSECNVGGERAAEIATKASELVKAMLLEDVPAKEPSIGDHFGARPGAYRWHVG